MTQRHAAEIATVSYYDSDEEGETTRYEHDTGHLPFAARACDACNNAGEHAQSLASTVAAKSRAARPALVGVGKEALSQTERAGIAASDAVASALQLQPGREAVARQVCDKAVDGMDRVCTAALPLVDRIEALVVPYVQAIGQHLLSIDRDVCSDNGDKSVLRPHVLHMLAGMENLGLRLQLVSTVVEGSMRTASASLDHRLGKLAQHTGVTRRLALLCKSIALVVVLDARYDEFR